MSIFLTLHVKSDTDACLREAASVYARVSAVSISQSSAEIGGAWGRMRLMLDCPGPPTTTHHLPSPLPLPHPLPWYGVEWSKEEEMWVWVWECSWLVHQFDTGPQAPLVEDKASAAGALSRGSLCQTPLGNKLFLTRCDWHQDGKRGRERGERRREQKKKERKRGQKEIGRHTFGLFLSPSLFFHLTFFLSLYVNTLFCSSPGVC